MVLRNTLNRRNFIASIFQVFFSKIPFFRLKNFIIQVILAHRFEFAVENLIHHNTFLDAVGLDVVAEVAQGLLELVNLALAT